MATKCYAIVQKSTVTGDGLFATKDFKAGELICEINRPLVIALDIRFLPHACSNCAAVAADPRAGLHDPDAANTHLRACTQCKVLRYCSKQCQIQSWKRHHKDECRLFARYSDRGPLSNTMRAVLQMLSASPDEQVSPFKAMTSHLAAIADKGGERHETIQILSAGLHNVFYPNRDISSIQQCFALIYANSFTLNTPTFDPIGVVLDPFAAKANHSCEPNAFVVFDGVVMSFRTLKVIKKEEEILVSYIDNTLPFSRRQGELKDRYFFTCYCAKCCLGATLTEDLFATNPKQPAPKSNRTTVLSPTTEGSQPCLSDETGLSKHSSTSVELSAVELFAFDKLDASRTHASTSFDNSETTAVLKVLKEGLRPCQETSLWPEYRQPIPALRQDVFVSLLSSAFDNLSWSYAFMQGCKLYFVVHPVLYPVTFHPSRIILKWTMANLALLLADPQTPVADAIMGLDLGVVVVGLLTEVRDNVRQSHGEKSKFAQTVNNKLNEVIVDITRGDKNNLQGMQSSMLEQWSYMRRLADIADADYWMACV